MAEDKNSLRHQRENIGSQYIFWKQVLQILLAE